MFRVLPLIFLFMVAPLLAHADTENGVSAFKRGNYAKAYAELSLEVEDGNNQNPKAMYYLGLMYRDGLGVEEDITKASIFLARSSKWNYPPALYELLLANEYYIYLRIIIEAKEDARAYEAATRKNMIQDMVKTSDPNKYTSQDLESLVDRFMSEQKIELAKWAFLAAEHGSERASGDIPIILQITSPDERATAKSRAEIWKRQISN